MNLGRRAQSLENGGLSTHLEHFGPEENQALLVKLLGEIRQNKNLTKQMQNMSRFERYFKSARDIKNKDMEELGHAINTYDTVVELAHLDPELGKIDVSRMKLTALIHDLGELEEGDISYDEKQASDEEREKEVFLRKLGSFFPGLGQDELGALKKIYFEIALTRDKTKGEARYFSMVERLGYLKTALQEFESQSDAIDWQWLCANVLHNQGKKDLLLIQEMPVAVTYLHQKKDALQNMVDWAEKQIGTVKDFMQEDLAVWREILSKI